MKDNISLLVIFFIFSVLSNSIDAQVSDSIYHQRLNHLCKIWGFVKYHHSEIANGNVNWDDELIRTIPGIRTAPNNLAFNDTVLAMINRAGETQIGQGELPFVPDSLKLASDISWMDNAFLSTVVHEKLHYINEQFRPQDHVNVKNNDYGLLIEFTDEQYCWPGYYPEEEKRVLALFRFWNIINYFYPHKFIMDQNWDSILLEFAPKITMANSRNDYHLRFKELVNKINDSHSYFYSPIISVINGAYQPPFNCMYIDDKMVINKVLPSESNLKSGDIITHIDGYEITHLRDSLMIYAQGSNPTSKNSFLNKFILTGDIEPFPISVFNGIDTISYISDRIYIYNSELSDLHTTPIWYDTTINNSCSFGIIDMGRLENEHIAQVFEDFREKNVIIFDVRSYPNSTLWTIVDYIYPSSIHIANFTEPDAKHPGTMVVTEEHIGNGTSEPYNGKVIILFNELTQSQAEYTVMGLEQYPNSIKVGSTTKAADGGISYAHMPGKIDVMFTAQGVFYNDFTPTQRVGILPDYYVRPTIEGLRAGKDEVLEFALNCYLKTDELNNQVQIIIFPNPSDGIINYEFHGKNYVPKSTIRLTNLSGQVVYEKTICDFKGSISTKAFPSGVYLLTIFNDEFRKTEKIIIK